MNAATLTLSQEEIEVLRLVAGIATKQPIRGLARLRQALETVRPGRPFHFESAEIAAADRAFALAAEAGVVSPRFGTVFQHTKAVFAAAAAD